jgi:hypothetical protein
MDWRDQPPGAIVTLPSRSRRAHPTIYCMPSSVPPPPRPGRARLLRRLCRPASRTVTVLASIAGLALGTATPAPAAAAAVPIATLRPARTSPLANPKASVHPSRAFKISCFTPGHTAKCNQAALANVDKARAGEGLRSLHLPAGFASKSTLDQLAIISDRERNVRGLPSMGVSPALNRAAQLGAARGEDPTGPANFTWGSNISWGYATPLAADFGWMYDDGPDSPNIGCPHAAAPGCWGHRDNILSPWPGRQGNGAFDNHGTIQLTELFVKNY